MKVRPASVAGAAEASECVKAAGGGVDGVVWAAGAGCEGVAVSVLVSVEVVGGATTAGAGCTVAGEPGAGLKVSKLAVLGVVDVAATIGAWCDLLPIL